MRRPPSLGRVPADPVPRRQQYYEGATTPCHASLRLIVFASRYHASPAVCLCSLARSRHPAGRGRAGDFLVRRTLVTVLPHVDRTGPPRFPDEPSRGSAIALRPRPALQHLASRGAGGAAPTVLKMKASTMKAFRGSITPLRHPLCTLHDIRYQMPCHTHSRLAGCAFAGQVSNLLARSERFQFITSSSPGLVLAQQHSLPAGGRRLCRAGVEPAGSRCKVSAHAHPSCQGFP